MKYREITEWFEEEIVKKRREQCPGKYYWEEGCWTDDVATAQAKIRTYDGLSGAVVRREGDKVWVIVDDSPI